jgi:two-component system, NarL family, sensor histidine kinase DegS
MPSLRQIKVSSKTYATLGDQALRSRERFVRRALTLAYARLIILLVGFGLLAMPEWSHALGLSTPLILIWYLVIITYTALNVVYLRNKRWGRPITTVTVGLDLAAISFLVFASGGLSSHLVALLLIYSTVVALIFPHHLIILAPLASMGAIAFWRHYAGFDDPLTAFHLTWYGALNLVVVATVVHIATRDTEQTREIVALERHLKGLAVVDERNRLAREMHDGIGAALSGMIIQAEYLLTQAKGHDALYAEALEIHELASTAIEELRRSLTMMRADFELVPALREYCATFAQRQRVKIEFEIGIEPPEMTGEQQLAFFRVLQECLTNATKHGSPTKVTAKLDFTDGRLILDVEDNGRGFDPTAEKVGHYGLVNMRERATRWGGSFAIESAPGSGCRVIFTVPIKPPEVTIPGELYEASQIRQAHM